MEKQIVLRMFGIRIPSYRGSTHLCLQLKSPNWSVAFLFIQARVNVAGVNVDLQNLGSENLPAQGPRIGGRAGVFEDKEGVASPLSWISPLRKFFNLLISTLGMIAKHFVFCRFPVKMNRIRKLKNRKTCQEQ